LLVCHLYRNGNEVVVDAGGFKDVEEDNFQKKVGTKSWMERHMQFTTSPPPHMPLSILHHAHLMKDLQEGLAIYTCNCSSPLLCMTAQATPSTGNNDLLPIFTPVIHAWW